MKTEYFNTAFVFLRYIKNKLILIKMDRKICKKIMDVFENVFFFVNFWTGQTRNKIGLGPTRKKTNYLILGWSQPNRVDWADDPTLTGYTVTG
jgi:hypothetical protein